MSEPNVRHVPDEDLDDDFVSKVRWMLSLLADGGIVWHQLQWSDAKASGGEGFVQRIDLLPAAGLHLEDDASVEEFADSIMFLANGQYDKITHHVFGEDVSVIAVPSGFYVYAKPDE